VAEAALVLYVVYMALAFGLRSYLMWRATGSTGFKGISGSLGSPEWLAGVLFVVALVVGVAAPVLALTGTAEPIEALDAAALNWIGVALAVGGIALTLYAQLAMGESWRIGVDPSERTELVTSGPFAWVRNPIFSAMIPDGARPRAHGPQPPGDRGLRRARARTGAAGPSRRGALLARPARRDLPRVRAAHRPVRARCRQVAEPLGPRRQAARDAARA